MNDKCTHETTIVNAPENYSGFSILRCTWACGQDLIELDLGNHEVKTYTAADIIALRDRVKELEEAAKPFVDAYKIGYDKSQSAQVCLSYMNPFISYGDYRELAAAMEGDK